MSKKLYREAYFYGDYFENFYNSLDKKVQLKISWTIELIETIERVPSKYFEHLTNTDGLYEIRVEFRSNIYRIFSFFDDGKLIILINGFQKKSQKTPKKEIDKAIKIKKQYFDEKAK